MKGKNMSYQRNSACILTKCVFRGKPAPLHLHVFLNSMGCLLAGCPSYNSMDKGLCLLGEPVFILVGKDRQQSNVTGTLLCAIQGFILLKFIRYIRKCKLKSTQVEGGCHWNPTVDHSAQTQDMQQTLMHLSYLSF